MDDDTNMIDGQEQDNSYPVPENASSTPYPAMSEGQGHSYPLPENTSSTPYPALDQDGSATAERRSTLPIGSFPLMTGSSASSMADTNQGYLSLSNYFQLGRTGLKALKAPQVSTGDGDDGAADDDEVAEEGDVEDDRDQDEGGGQLEDEDEEDEAEYADDEGYGEGAQGDEQQLASEQPARAVEQQTAARQPEKEDDWTSLPGHHGLPDEDYMESRTDDVWPHRIDPAANYIPIVENAPIRGRGRGRGRPRGRGEPRIRGQGRRGWKWAVQGTDHEEVFHRNRITAEAAGTKRRGRGGRAKRSGARGRPRGAKRQGSKGPRPRAEPNEAFKALQASATTAFLENDLDRALDLALQAIANNPEVAAPHFLINQVLTAQGREEEAMAAHYLAAFASRDSSTWLAVSERYAEYAREKNSDADYKRAYSCLSEALKVDKDNMEIRATKVDLFIEMKMYKQAFRECGAMLKLVPEDTDTLWKFAEILKLLSESKEDKAAREGRAPRVVEAYRAAFHAWRAEPVFGDANMQWAHLDMYIGILEEIGTPPLDCIRELKQISRWLLGRGNEIFWDSINDDREFDIGFERRILTDFWRARMFQLDEARYGKGLPLWLRAKLGYLRAKMGFLNTEESTRHLDVLRREPSAAEDNPEVFMTTAEKLYELRWYHDAISLYEAAKDQEHVERHRFFLGMGRCYQWLSRTDEAEKAFRAAVEADKEKMDARIELAKLYAHSGRRVEAANVANEISRMGRADIQRSERILMQSAMRPAQQLSRKAQSRAQPKAPPRAIMPAPPNTGNPNRPGVFAQNLPAEYPVPSTEVRQPEMSEFGRGEEEMDDEMDIDGDSSDDEMENMLASYEQAPSAPRRRDGRKKKLAYDEEIQQLREQRARVQNSYELLKKLWPFIDGEGDGDEDVAKEWMGHAEAMAKEFTSTKVFYPSQRADRFSGLLAGRNTETRQVIAEMEMLRQQMKDVTMENAAETDNLPTADDRTAGEFHDISFQEWHRILSDLALQHARFADEEKCKRTIESLTRGNVFRHDFALYNTTLALSIYCAITFNDRELFLESARQYLYQSDYRSGMAYQIFAASLSIGHGDSPLDYDASKLQQWTQRLVKLQDILVMDPEMRKKWEWGSFTEHSKDGTRHERMGQQPNEGLIPGLLTTYAHIVTSRRRVHNSSMLAYLFRALALQPDDVITNLSLATNYIIDALRRAENTLSALDRQKTIQQGLGFFYRYYNARIATGKKAHAQEAEYNAARIWDLLGWTHLAGKGYERVLKLSGSVREEAEAERRAEEVEDLSTEAAVALQRIFVEAGNEVAARELGEEWLVM